MNTCNSILTVALAVLTLSASAGHPFIGCKMASGADADAWVSLFNAKDLTGWKLHGGEKWYVDDGAIVCESTTKKYAYLATEKIYRNFILQLQLKAERPGNSGIFFRATLEGVEMHGIQFEVDPKQTHLTGGLYETGGRGWLFKPKEEAQPAFKPGEWNHVEVRVDGNRIVTRLNDKLVADFVDEAPIMHKGVIALQIHEGDDVKIRWKDLRLKEIGD